VVTLHIVVVCSRAVVLNTVRFCLLGLPVVGQAVTEFKAGKVEYRADKTGIVHVLFGKSSFTLEDLVENLTAVAVSYLVLCQGDHLMEVVLYSRCIWYFDGLWVSCMLWLLCTRCVLVHVR